MVNLANKLFRVYSKRYGEEILEKARDLNPRKPFNEALCKAMRVLSWT